MAPCHSACAQNSKPHLPNNGCSNSLLFRAQPKNTFMRRLKLILYNQVSLNNPQSLTAVRLWIDCGIVGFPSKGNDANLPK